MGRFLLALLLFTCSLIAGEQKIWGSHSAYIMPTKAWSVGIFQPFRYGLSDNLETSFHPGWFFIVPNASFKMPLSDMGSFKAATRVSLVYPTPLLNMISREGIGGLIDPNLTTPPMLGVSSSLLLSKEVFGINTTSKLGVDIGLVMGELDTRSNIDLPIVYHRLEVFHNKWGLHAGLDLVKDVTNELGLFLDLDLRLLPDLDKDNGGQEYSMHSGDYSIEHKLFAVWKRSNRFRVLAGYKLVTGDYPYGKQTRLLPYIPMLEKWGPIIEMQWAKF